MRDWANAIRPYNFSHHSVGANRIRPRLYSPPFAFVHVYIHPIIIRLYHYFIEQMPIGRIRFAPIFIHPNIYIPSFHPFQWANSIRPYIGTHIFPHPVRANRIRPLIYPSPIYIPPFHPIHGRIRFAPTYLHTYLFRIPYGRIAFAPIFIHPNIYIPPFHPFQWANSIRPYIGTHIFPHPVRANRIRPNQHSPNIFSDNIKDKFENSDAYTPKDLGFSPAKTRSFTLADPGFLCTPQPTF